MLLSFGLLGMHMCGPEKASRDTCVEAFEGRRRPVAACCACTALELPARQIPAQVPALIANLPSVACILPTMPSYLPPGESITDLWLERSVFAGGMLVSFAYGVFRACVRRLRLNVCRDIPHDHRRLCIFHALPRAAGQTQLGFVVLHLRALPLFDRVLGHQLGTISPQRDVTLTFVLEGVGPDDVY